MLKISTAPHINSPQDTRSIMRDVIIALMPALAAALLFFGLSALVVVLTAVAGCVAFEYLACRYILKIPPTTGDLSAVVTGLLLAYNLPSNMPVWMVLVGCFVAVVIAKTAFGGLGKNVFNPALVGRVFLFISFPVQMTSWPKPDFLNFLNADVETGATTLGILKHIDAESSATKLAGGLSDLPDYGQMFIGYTGGCIGEVSSLLLLAGGIFLIAAHIITWRIPVIYIGSFAILSWIFGGIPYGLGAFSGEILVPVFSGGLMLGAFFMATDWVTTPTTPKGEIIFAAGCGFFTFLIRYFGSLPEGVSLAIILMNIITPTIDRFVKVKPFGYVKKPREKKEAKA